MFDCIGWNYLFYGFGSIGWNYLLQEMKSIGWNYFELLDGIEQNY